MKLALFADIHANLEALGACMEHAKFQGATSFAFLGDLVGYGADPSAVLDIVQEQFSEGAIVVRGNHDNAVLEPSETMNDSARAAIEWTRGRLQPAQIDFLAQLPLVIHEDGMTFVHASAAAPEKWLYISDSLRAAHSLEAAGSTYVFSGHVHEPVLYYTGAGGRPLPFEPVAGKAIPVARHRRWLAIPGSVGQPRDGNPAACYALFDAARVTLTYYRIPYDYDQAAAKIRSANLPERLALRLEHGD
jgi:diadenosine tetraphosphatase ApaH/serine/threonine PP2A family protein phosphatase